jgi:uncharacterized transporter YbjL
MVDRLFELLAAEPFVAIFLVLACGYLLGRTSIGFFSMGSTAGSILCGAALLDSTRTDDRRTATGD